MKKWRPKRFLVFGLCLYLISIPLTAQEEVLQEVVVRPGDTLWSIANKYLKDPQRWPDIVRANNINAADPTITVQGSRLKIPVVLIKEEYRTADLISLVPEVRYKRKGEEEWKEARKDMVLKYEDSLRTMKAAGARVRFPSKEVVQINENSYVVLKPEKILQEVQLFQGDIRASRAKVIMPTGTVVIPKGQSDYQAKVREDNSEVVFVYKGNVDVTAKGKTITVPEGFGTQVLKSMPPMKPVPLSTFKDFDPADMNTEAPKYFKIDPNQSVLRFNPPAVSPKGVGEGTSSKQSKSMMAQNMWVKYHIQLAKDEKFELVVLDKTESTETPFDLRKQNIADGGYFMRVAFLDALGAQGKYSVPNPLNKDTQAPVIKNLIPPDGQKFQDEESACEVGGVVQGAVAITINGEVVFIDPKGNFGKNIFLKEGPNKIQITARDGAGNETHLERQVTYSKKRL